MLVQVPVNDEAGLAESLSTALIDLLEICEAYFLSMIHFQFTYSFKHSIWKFSEFFTDFMMILSAYQLPKTKIINDLFPKHHSHGSIIIIRHEIKQNKAKSHKF